MISTFISKYFSKFSDWYVYAKENQQLSFWIVFALAVYLPFEEFIVKFTPFRGVLLFLFRQITGELIVYALFLKLIYEKLFRDKKLRKTPLDPLFIAFLISVTISILANGSSLVASLVNLRPLLRYITLYYVVVNLEISKEQLALLLKTTRIIGLIQSCLASLQYFAPRSFTRLFIPRGTDVSVGGHERYMSSTKVGAAVGTMGRPAAFTSFVFIAFPAFLVDAYRRTKSFLPARKDLIWTLIIFFGIFATLKRASLVIALLIPLLLLFHLGRKKDALVISWFYSGLALALAMALLSINLNTISFSGSDARTEEIDTSAYLVQIFTPDYWEQANENSRGWLLRTIGGSVLRSEGIWFGLSPDQNVVRDNLIRLNLSDTLAQERFEVTEAFEDVYWVAMFAYYGIVGLGIYLLILWRLYRASRWLIVYSSDPDYQSLGAILCTTIIVVLIYAWIERIWEIKSFGFIFGYLLDL